MSTAAYGPLCGAPITPYRPPWAVLASHPGSLHWVPRASQYSSHYHPRSGLYQLRLEGWVGVPPLDPLTGSPRASLSFPYHPSGLCLTAWVSRLLHLAFIGHACSCRVDHADCTVDLITSAVVASLEVEKLLPTASSSLALWSFAHLSGIAPYTASACAFTVYWVYCVALATGL